jgi:hypothetical protein
MLNIAKKSIQAADQNLVKITETTTAIFIIAAVSLFILANFLVGFNLPLYLFALVLGFALTVAYPRSGVYAIVFLTFVFERFFTLAPIYWNRTEYKIYPLDILFLGVILGSIFVGVRHLQKNKLTIIDWLVAIFFLASAVYFFVSVSFLSADPAIAFSTFKNYAFYGLFYFAIIFLFNDKEKLFELLKFIIAGAVVITIFIFIGIFRGEGLWTEFTPLSTPGARILAFPQAFYLTLAVLISLAVLCAKNKTARSKAGTDKSHYCSASFKNIPGIFSGNCSWPLALVPIWLVGIIGSLMRHLWISLFISIIVLYFLLPKESQSRFKKILFHYFLAALALLIVLAYLSFLFPHSSLAKTFSGIIGITGKRFVSTVQVSSDESLNWRRLVWQSTWKEFQHSLLFGLGYGKKISVEIGTKYRDFVEIRNIHNSLLTIFIQMGLWSLALISAIFWLLFKPVYSGLRKSTSPELDETAFLQVVFLALFVNYLIAFLFQTYLETNLLGIFFWLTLGGLRNTNLANSKRQFSENTKERRTLY